jgi:exportin-2 (importin alpha re-exporter)
MNPNQLSSSTTTLSLESVPHLLLHTLSSDQKTHNEAVRALMEIERSQRSLPLTLLRIVQHPTDQVVAFTAAIYFKNYIRRNWDSPSSSAAANTNGNIDLRTFQIMPEERETIKRNIVEIMCTSSSTIQKQLAEAVRIIAEHDWPGDWGNLLPALIERADPGTREMTDPVYISTLVGVLSTMNELFKRFRDAPKSDPLWLQLQYALQQVQQPLLILFGKISAIAINWPIGHEENRLEVVYIALRLMARIFYSLNWQDLPEFFEDYMQQWMDLFHPFLILQINPLPSKGSNDEAGPVERLQTAILECCRLYAEKYGKEFHPHLRRFVQATFHVLVLGSKAPQPRYDELVTTGMRFIAAAVVPPANVELFGQSDTLRNICELIVIPNLALRISDKECFEDNPLEYLRRDIESSDADTRRRVACELVEKLCRNYDNEITSYCFQYLSHLLQKYASNPQMEWVAKDAAITLFLAVMIRTQTQRDGATKVKDPNLVVEFLKLQIFPELINSPMGNEPNIGADILKADAVKFIATFRRFIPKMDVLSSVLPLLVQCLDSRSIVVYTYAAEALDGILSVREMKNENSVIVEYGEARYLASDVRVHLEQILVKLFALIELGGAAVAAAAAAVVAAQQQHLIKRSPTVIDNEHLIKCVVRVIFVAGNEVGPIVPNILQQLGRILFRICVTSTNPVFNHFLFESIAATNKFGVESGAVTVETLEAVLNPAFEKVLTSFQEEFMPYVFQIMAQLLKLRQDGSPIPHHYVQIFIGLLVPQLWESRANVPALVGLLQAMLMRRGGPEVLIAGDAQRVSALFQIFERLLLTKTLEDVSFQLLSCVVNYCPTPFIAPHLVAAIRGALNKLQRSHSINLAQSFVSFMGVLCCRQGPMICSEAMDQLEPGLMLKIVDQIWIPVFGKIRGETARKMCALGATRLLVESTQLRAKPEVWSKLFRAQVLMLAERVEMSRTKLLMERDLADTNDALERMAESGYSTNFVRLSFAGGSASIDFFPEVQNETIQFVQALVTFANTTNPPGVAKQLIAMALGNEATLWEELKVWLGQAGLGGSAPLLM